MKRATKVRLHWRKKVLRDGPIYSVEHLFVPDEFATIVAEWRRGNSLKPLSHRHNSSLGH